MDLNSMMNNSIVVVPLILAVVQGYKLFVNEKAHRYAPLVSILVGILFAWLFNTGEDYVTLKSVIGGGIIAGLSASGLYSGLSSSMRNNKDID